MSATRKPNLAYLDTLRLWMVANQATAVTIDGVSMVLDPGAFPTSTLEVRPGSGEQQDDTSEEGPHARIRREHAAATYRKENGDE